MTNPLLALVITALGALAFGGRIEPPTEFPSFSRETAAPLVIVATLAPGKSFPQFGKCADTDVICMDPPPFWYEAKVRFAVYGNNVPRRVALATTSHYGMQDRGSEPYLVAAVTDGRQFVMPRYAMARLTADKAGQLHVLVLGSRPVHWLPCSVWLLRKEIAPEQFGANLLIPTEHATPYVQEDPQLFRTTPAGVVPRYAIKVKDIGAHLRALAPSSSQMLCRHDS